MTPTEQELLERLRNVSEPLKQQLVTVAIISGLLRKRGKAVPVLVGGVALSYFTREVYFTSDIDLAYADRQALGEVLTELGFQPAGRFWLHPGLNIMIEAPASSLAGEDAPHEIVDLGDGLECRIIGLEDLLIDRMNACRHWRSSTDCEMVELLVRRFRAEIDWKYLLTRAEKPENDTASEFMRLRDTV